mmetsp:Transcript_3650/g.5484  ORF Transcript_3650/g.5484 Transcript_3650/m.5484 type:complete len:104 (-) Transcript_3650:1611-1922(-)
MISRDRHRKFKNATRNQLQHQHRLTEPTADTIFFFSATLLTQEYLFLQVAVLRMRYLIFFLIHGFCQGRLKQKKNKKNKNFFFNFGTFQKVALYIISYSAKLL